jgi:DNA (cytosine-5)-methyltransferase 1
MVGIDIFAGAGGMSLGAQWAGIKMLAAIEADEHAAQTYALNHPDIAVVNSKVEDIGAIDFRHGDELILFGGPPCQGFSTSNQRTRSPENEGNWLYREFIRVCRMLEPEWIVIENVKGILETDNGSFLSRILVALKRLGYKTDTWALNAADFGVPQARTRLFVIGAKTRSLPKAPSPIPRRVTVRDAIADLPVLKNGSSICSKEYRCLPRSLFAEQMRKEMKTSCNHLVTRTADHIIERYRYIPQGGNWENIPARLMGNYADRTRCHTGIYHRLIYNEPSVVIGNFRKNMLIHPTQNRGLSVREAARLQSFPDYFVFTGSIGFQQQQVGNAVPPLLAYAVFASILTPSGGEGVCGQSSH